MCHTCKNCLYDAKLQSCAAVERGEMSIKKWCDHYDRPDCPHYKKGTPHHFNAAVWEYKK